MKRKTHILAAATLMLAATTLSAYVLLSPERTWNGTPTYIVDDRGMASIADGDRGVAATVNAITSNQAWNGAGAGTVIDARSGSVARYQLGDGIPMLNFTDPWGFYCTGNCLAATFTGFYSSGGNGTWQIDDADIITNDRFNWTSTQESSCSSEFYIEGVMVHEAGHGLGLHHTDVWGATMYPSVSSCNNGPATTEKDDEDGIMALYGTSGGGGGGDPDPSPPSCDLGSKGESCTVNSECCSGKCRGKRGAKVCR